MTNHYDDILQRKPEPIVPDLSLQDPRRTAQGIDPGIDPGLEDLLQSTLQEAAQLDNVQSMNPQGPVDSSPGSGQMDPAAAMLLEDIAKADKLSDAAVLRALHAASKVNPEVAGEAQRLGIELGMDAGLVESNLEKARALWTRRQTEALFASGGNEQTLRALVDPEFARIARDDVENLSFLENLWQQRSAAKLEEQQSLLWAKVMYGGGDDADIAKIDTISRQLAELPPDSDVGGFVENLAYGAMRTWSGMEATLLISLGAGLATAGAGAAYGMTSGPLAPATATAGAFTGFSVGFFGSMGINSAIREGGAAYGSMIEMGIDPAIARRWSTGVGMVNGALEVLSAGVLSQPFKAEAKRILTRKVAKDMLTRTTRTAAATRFALTYAKGLGSEVATEVAQEISNVLGESIARWEQQGIDPTTLKETDPFFERMSGIITETLRGMALLGLPGPLMQLRTDMKRARQGAFDKKWVESLGKQVEKSKTRPRNRRLFARFLEQLADGTDADRLYFDVKEFKAKMEAVGMTPAQLADIAPEVAGRLREAEKTGLVEIPTSEFGAEFLATDFGKTLIPHARVTPDGVTPQELANVQKREIDEQAKKAEELLKKFGEKDSEYKKQADAIEQTFEREMLEAGRKPAEAKAGARYYRNLALILAAEEGISPAEWQRKAGVGLLSESAFAELNLDADSVAHMRLWFRKSAVVDKEGRPLVVEHFGWFDETTDVPDSGMHFGTAKAAKDRAASKRMSDRNVEVYEDPEEQGRWLYSVDGEQDVDSYGSKEEAEMAARADMEDRGLLRDDEGRTTRAYLRIENPKRVEDAGGDADAWAKLIEEAKAEGHDGLVYTNQHEDVGSDSYVIFEPQQAKSLDSAFTESPKMLEQLKDDPTQEESDASIDKAIDKAADATPPHEIELTDVLRKKARELASQNKSGFGKVWRSLPDDEVVALVHTKSKGKTAMQLLASRMATLWHLLRNLPRVSEVAAVARAGRSKRGWYRYSQKALEIIFGEDAPRFAALLAATSPQTSVEANLLNTLNIWRNWNKAGRPTDPRVIMRILGESVQGTKGVESVLNAWVNNSIVALTMKDPKRIVLSGPKVNSFMLNLLGWSNELTNDAWMANYFGVDQNIFATDDSVHLPGKGPGYIASSTRQRQAAASLNWNPMEVQETVWSFAKALYEKASRMKTTAVELLKSGGLTHEDINATPDFEKLFLSPEYRHLVEAAGYGKQLEELAKDVASRAEEPVQGPVYDAKSPDAKHLLRAAKRLDKLAEVRRFEKTRTEVLVNLSAATSSIPGLKELADEANKGDQEAAVLLQDIAADSLRYLLSSVKSAKVEVNRVTGLYAGDLEPSLQLSVSFQNKDRARALVALRQFARNFNQQQFHVRSHEVTGKAGKVYPDGSFNTIVRRFELKKEMSRAEIEAVAREAGLVGFTVHENALEVYFVGDPTDAQASKQFVEATQRARVALGKNIERVGRSIERLWAYGDGFGATHGYDSIEGEFRPPKGDQAARTAQRIASRLAGRKVVGSKQAAVITEEQRALQTRIAEAYGRLELDRLDDPIVRRAYEEAANEIVRQFKALPIKVEVFEGKGEPYGGKGMSAKMRKDINARNHLFIFATIPDQFGPPGVTYKDHPLLADSGLKDINGRPLLINDLLRAVHDYYAHTMQTTTFGPLGEEAAWRTHMEMTRSPWARWAITSETRGQNSWVNFNREVDPESSLSKRPFSEQKVDLLPLEFVVTGIESVDRSLLQLPGSDGLVLQQSAAEQEASGAGQADRAGDTTAAAEQAASEAGQVPGADVQGVEQREVNAKRAGRYLPDLRTILLDDENATPSTVFHELSHFWFFSVLDMAARGVASKRLLADIDTLLRWFKIEGKTPEERLANFQAMDFEAQRRHHETLAYNFENYLFDGKAPTSKLERVFAKIRTFLLNTYESIRDELNAIYKSQFGTDLPGLTPEVRAVFDRMVATRSAVANAEAARAMRPMFQTLEEFTAAGYTEEQWAEYLAVIEEAREEAETDLQAATLRQLKWLRNARGRLLKQKQKEVEGIRRAARSKMQDEVEEEHVYLAMGIVRSEKAAGKILESDVDRVLGDMPEKEREKIKKKLGTGRKGLLSKQGLRADNVADALGYRSGEEMLREFANARPIDDEIEMRTSQYLLDQHGELLDQRMIEEAIDRALHKEARARFVAAELRFLEGIRRPARVQIAAAKDAARRALGGRRIKELRPDRFSQAEARAARQAERAQKKGDTKAAVEAKRQQLLLNQMVGMAYKARDEIGKMLGSFRKLMRSNDQLAKMGNVDVLQAAKWILAQYGLATQTAAERATDYLSLLREYDPALFARLEPELAKAQARGAELGTLKNGAPNWRELTLDELRVVHDTVDTLVYRAQRDQKLLVEGKMEELESVVDTLIGEIKIPEEVHGESGALTYWQRAKMRLLGTRANLIKLEHYLRALDGGKQGPFLRYLFNEVRASVDAYRTDAAVYVKKLVEIVSELRRSGLLEDGKIDAHELNYTFGEGNRGGGMAELFGLLLHMGNSGNKERALVAGRGGVVDPKTGLMSKSWADLDAEGNFDYSRWEAFLDRMKREGKLKPEHFRAAQRVWDLMEEIKPKLQEAHRELEGYYFKEVQADPFTVEFPDGTVETYRGGYVPATRDTDLLPPGELKLTVQEMQQDFFNGLPKVPDGSTKERAARYTKRPLAMDVNKIAAHIDETIRYAHVQPRVADVLRIIGNERFATAITRVDPNMIRELIIPFLERAVRQSVYSKGVDPTQDWFWKMVRRNTGVAIMFGNVVNTLQQVTGISNSLIYVKARYLRSALYTYMRKRGDFVDAIIEKSEFMDDRLRNQMLGLTQDLRELALDPSTLAHVQSWTGKKAYFMQTFTQNQVDIVTWWGAYEQAIANGKQELEATREADSTVRLAQGSFNPEDVANYETGTPVARTWNQFTSYFNTVLNQIAFARGNKARAIALSFTVPMVISQAIAMTLWGQWDDEDDDGHVDTVFDLFVGSQLGGAAAMVPVYGPALYGLMSQALSNREFGDKVAASPAMVTVQRSLAGLFGLAAGEQPTGRRVRDGLTAVVLMVPGAGIIAPVIRPTGYLIDVASGKVKPRGAWDVATGIMTGRASEGSRR